MSNLQPHIGKRRSKSWWEPTYDPNLDDALDRCQWIFINSTGPKQSFMSADVLKALMKEGEVQKFEGLTFTDCDFQGTFDHTPSILFDKCRFQKCDFAFSKWVRTNFRNCTFDHCSLALSSFHDCEFRECSWSCIGFSGSKTEIKKTFVDNPARLVKSGYSGTNPSDSNDTKHRRYQKYRLEETKAHLARNILSSHQDVGDDTTFYKTARLHDLQQVRFRISKSIFLFRHGEKFIERISGLFAPLSYLELILLEIVGLVNGWGSRLLRPLLLLISSAAIFAIIYSVMPQSEHTSQPWQRSFDIASIAGYANQSVATETVLLRIIIGIQLVISIFLYTIFFSTAVSRFSRAR